MIGIRGSLPRITFFARDSLTIPMTLVFDNSYARLPAAFFASVQPTAVESPSLIKLNTALASELGLDLDWLQSSAGTALLAGNAVTEQAEPIAMAYSGHQFGGFSPQLGDGRAILLGEVVGNDGLRRDVQLKGSGPTPFSRRGDGRSALGPVLREYIVSEAMAALGVPTTRALAVVASGESVIREGLVPGGVFTRVAASHIRIGTFQWFAARQDIANLKILADYVIDRHYPEIAAESSSSEDTDGRRYTALLQSVMGRQANLVAKWMQFGFIHGVMNTDNMAVSGETIDYGPCAFMDEYHPAKTFSSIDQQGRYAFGNQANMAHWNLMRFAETLLSLIDEDSEKAICTAQEVLNGFPELHKTALQACFFAKLGINSSSGAAREGDWQLVEGLLDAMAEGNADFTLTFRHLTTALEADDDRSVLSLFSCTKRLKAWLVDWRERLQSGNRADAIALMRRHNPILIPRNHRVEEAIQAGNNDDFQVFHRLNAALESPFEDRAEFREYESPPAPEEIVHATFCGT